MKATWFALGMCCALIPSAGYGQDPAAAIMRESINYLSRESVKSLVTIDPRVFEERAPPPIGRAVPLHSPEILASLPTAGLSVLATLDRAVACNNPALAQCKTNGRAAFASLRRPVIRGDSATLSIFVRGATSLTAKDSADIRARHIQREALMRAPGYRGPTFNTQDSTNTFERRSRGGGAHMAFSLVRSNGVWKVVAMKILGQS
jgi:hypothetical protein